MLERLANVIYWLFNFISGILIVFSIALYYDYLSGNGDLFLSLAALLCGIIAFPIGWSIRYIFSGNVAWGFTMSDGIRAKINPIILIWGFRFVGVGLGQNAFECINPVFTG